STRRHFTVCAKAALGAEISSPFSSRAQAFCLGTRRTLRARFPPPITYVNGVLHTLRHIMLVDRWLRWLRQALDPLRNRARPRKRPSKRIRPSVESLESRALMATLNLSPIADDTLYQDPTGHLSNGAGPNFYVGDTNQAASVRVRRGIIKFDLSS